MATDKPRFSITFEDDLFDQIEDFRHEHRISTRSKAVVKLVEKGIESLVQENPDLADIIKKAPSVSDEAMKIAKDYDVLDLWGKRTVRAVTDMELARVNEPDSVTELHPEKVIPLLGNSYAAGDGEPDFGNFWEDYAVPADSPADFAIRISGDSMEPWIPDGSIQLCTRIAPRDGDVGAFLIDGEYLCKQVCMDVAGTLHLFSLNRARRDKDRHIPRDEIERQVMCFGTVIMKRRVPLPID